MEHRMDQKVQAIHSRMDAFELRVLERPAPTVEVSTLKKELEGLHANIVVLLAPPETEPEYAPTTPGDDVMMSALFGDNMLPPDSSPIAGKRPCSGCTSDDVKAPRLRKRERQQTKVAQRASIIDEELRHQRANEVGVGTSARVSTTDGAKRVDVSTTDGVVRVDESTTEIVGIVDGSANDGIPSVDPVGSGKPNPPTS
ncbi:hypothetical protein R3W88_001134 [Solanum pinnatisectum]|uniref:Integrase core domain containing protein n=1 Tax=Solanum pinnatisectum TaxID=50273 RepID=A0AAV9MHC3_9SOLN|nr:hypothetical protein R3W88_001134 [Solanum pinnatisectum]